jgi:hypothetical protein
MLFKHCNLSD